MRRPLAAVSDRSLACPCPKVRRRAVGQRRIWVVKCFRSSSNFATVDELFTDNCMHHLPIPAVPAGRPMIPTVSWLVLAVVLRASDASIADAAADGYP